MVVFLVCSLGISQDQESTTSEYKIGPKDLLEINVVGESGFPFTVRVTEDGKISLPYVLQQETPPLRPPFIALLWKIF